MDLSINNIDLEDNVRRRQKGQYYFAFTPDQIADRKRCEVASRAFNNAGDVTRRKLVELFQKITLDTTPLPPMATTQEEDDLLFADFPWVDGPIRADFGHNIKLGKNVYINSNSTWIDTCPITIGDRTMFGPGVHLYSGTHPVCPIARNGLRGPEMGGAITVGEDCWLGGNVTVLAGVTIGRGTTIGAGSVVTKDIPEFSVAVGNPARVIRSVSRVPADQLPPGYNPYEEGSNEPSKTQT